MGAWGKSRRSERVTRRLSERNKHGHKCESNTQIPKGNLELIHLPQGTQCGRLKAASRGKTQNKYGMIKYLFPLRNPACQAEALAKAGGATWKLVALR
jgi:hypothetical protein